MSYQQASDDLNESARKIARSVPEGAKPSLDEKCAARRAIKKAVNETDFPYIADAAAEREVPLVEELDISTIEQVADAIANGKNGMYERFGDLITKHWEGY